MVIIPKEYDQFFKETEHKTPGLLYLSVREKEKLIDINNAIKEAMHILVTEQSSKESADFIINMWFKDLYLGHIIGDYCEFIASTQLRAGVILKKYKEQMEYCLEQIIGYHCEVRIMSLFRFQDNINSLHIPYTEEQKPKAEAPKELEITIAPEKPSSDEGDDAVDTLEALRNDPFATKPFTVGALTSKEGERSSQIGESEQSGEEPDSRAATAGEKESTDTEEGSAEAESKGGEALPPKREAVIDTYTFENFVEGDSNKFARAACMAVARFPTTYNPLFIYGNSGLGKTHLLNAVVHYIKKNHPHLKIIYKKCEKFLDELIAALRSGSTAEFKEYYRSCDVLLIDDVQFLAGKEQTQEEFFHTFSSLYEADKQIILTSDRPPRDIKPLEERLRTRFEGGLLADVQPPNFELRLAIIEKKATDMKLNIPQELIEYIAERLQNDIRQVEGLLKRINAVSSLTSVQINKKIIDDAISVIDPGNIPTDTLIERILSSVCKEFGVTVDELKSTRKTDNIANARHVAIYVIKKTTELSLAKIGSIFNRNHATVISSIEKVGNNIRTVNNYEEMIERIIKESGKKG